MHLILMILILSPLGYSTNLSAFPSLKPSSIDNKYDIPIGIPIKTSTTDPSINTKANLQDPTYSLESLPEELHLLESTVSPLATCEKLPATSATASGNDGNIPSNVIDNNLNTRWSNLGQGSWIQLDLGSKKSICSVDIAWYRGDIRQNNFVISVSDDGTTFNEKLTKTSNLGTAAEKYTLLGGTEGRYVRITVNGNTENDWASINEISVFGGDIGGGSESTKSQRADSTAAAQVRHVLELQQTGADHDVSGELRARVFQCPGAISQLGKGDLIRRKIADGQRDLAGKGVGLAIFTRKREGFV